MKVKSESSLTKQALDYHQSPTPGKTSIKLTKPTNNQRDLSLAYTPGVAEPVRAIHKNALDSYKYTNKGNLVAVISNGTAVLGLGNVGPLASKPVMEGKAVLFKHFADVDVFDIEIDAENSQALIETVVRIAPTFGGINLEDIKAPECFEVEHALQSQLNIPVFHDDQHGTAIVIAAALLNALTLQEKTLATAKIVCVGAGAAGIASMRLLISMGAKRENIILIDSKGVIHTGRTDLNPYKFAFALETELRTLADAVAGSDVFIGVSGPNVLTKEMLLSMANQPIVFALSNPDPEIHPDDAYSVRQDLVMATGRSDFPNQVNNVLAFPYIFRAALDCKASCINQEMMIAAVHAISRLAHEKVPAEIKTAYPNDGELSFGVNYILPKPIDPRLRDIIVPAVIQAAKTSGACELKKPERV